MRQQHQNRRGRGRGRKGQNPLSRNFESNGPDVKIRGNASHVAEKYMALARDAMSSGDLVMAENYLQHAEHYNRIIMAAQAPQRADDPGNGQRFGGRFDQASGDGDFGPDGDDDYDSDEREQPIAAAEQPVQQVADNQSERPERRFPQRQYERQGGGDYRGEGRGGDRGEQRHEARGDNRGEPRADRGDNRGDRGDFRGNRRRGRIDNGGNGRGPRPVTALTPGGPAEAAALAAANAGLETPQRRRPADDNRDDGQPNDGGLL